MRKLNFSIMVLSVLFIAACSKSNNNNDNNSNAKTYIQGTWNLTGMRYSYYNSSNQQVYSEYDIDGNVGQSQYKITASGWYAYYLYYGDNTYTLTDSASYTLNTTSSPMVLTISSGTMGAGGTIDVPLLTNTQMVWQIKSTPDYYTDSVTGNEVEVAYSILLDTLAKQQ